MEEDTHIALRIIRIIVHMALDHKIAYCDQQNDSSAFEMLWLVHSFSLYKQSVTK